MKVYLSKKEIQALLNYIYKLEEIIQDEGYFTGDYFTKNVDSAVSELQIKLDKAEKLY